MLCGVAYMLSRNARAASAPKGSKEYDQPNALVHIVCKLALNKGIAVPAFQKDMANKEGWRAATAAYYDTDVDHAKTLLMKGVTRNGPN